jgi:hypothetical protein
VGIFGSEIGSVGNHDTERDFDGAVVEVTLDAFDEESHQQADDDAAADEPDEADGSGEDCRSFAADDHGDAEFESEEASGVVDEAFAFEDVDDALRETEILGDGGGGDGVGGGDDGAEHNAEAKIEGSEGIVCGCGDSPDSKADEAKGEEENANDVVGKIAPASEPGGGV